MGELGRPLVLIVDDSLENIGFLGHILGNEYEVCFASNGRDALDLVAKLPVRLILLDVVMPEMGGFDVCRILKEDPETNEIPIIFLTSLETPEEEEFGLSLGAEDFIHKPVSSPVVLARVRNHLLLAEAKRALREQNQILEQRVEERTNAILLRDRQVIASQTATISAFCALVEARDSETGNHIHRTQFYIKALAEKLRNHPRFRHALNDESIALIVRSAPLHDVGKVAIPDAVLLKPDKLNDSEWEIMKRHCEIGYAALHAAGKDLGEAGAFLDYAAEIAYSHHERWNGKGYPRGLVGDEIPISGRLMAVADVYDALTSRRVYKQAFSHEVAMNMMRNERGQHFDPDVLDALIEISDYCLEIGQLYKD